MTTRSWVGPSAAERLRLMRRTRTVAMVGASDNPARASYFVATYLLSSSDFEVWFVNPRADTILGRPVYASLADLPGTPDLVDVFRRPQDLPGVLDETLEVGASTFWLQLGLWDDDIARREGWREELFDPGEEGHAIDRLVEYARGVDPIAAQRSDEGHRPPMAVGDLGAQPLAPLRPAPQGGHVSPFGWPAGRPLRTGFAQVSSTKTRRAGSSRP